MSDLEKAARQALDALENFGKHTSERECDEAITALRAALAQQAEPVELADKAINVAITTWFGDHKLDYFDNDEFLDRMRAAIKAAQDFKESK